MHAKIAAVLLLAATALAAPYDFTDSTTEDLVDRDFEVEDFGLEDAALVDRDFEVEDFEVEDAELEDRDFEIEDFAIEDAALEERAACPPAVNAATLSLVESSEGWSAKAYKDPTGHWTVGYGHLCSKANCAGVGYPLPLSKANGAKLLQSDLKIAENCINKAVSSKVKLNPNQYGALVDWAFNEGCGNVDSSTLIKDLNKGQNPNTVAKAQLPQWVFSDGVKLPGLVTRRAKEVKLFTTAAKGQAHPC